MNEIEGFVLDYFEEDYTSEFKKAMRNWDIKTDDFSFTYNDTDIDSIKKCENIIKNRLVPLNKVSAVYISYIGIQYSLYCNVGGFVIGQPIDPYNMDGLVFAETYSEEITGTSYTNLDWYKKDPPIGTFPNVTLRKTNGRPLKLLEKFNNIKNRKMW